MSQKKQSILIVEDDKLLRQALVDILVRKNFKTYEAKNGAEGLELALTMHPDLILLDILLPIMDGMAALRKIRKDNWGRNVPVIILTNVSATEEKIINDIVKERPLEYLVKSDWSLQDVVKKIQDVLAQPT